MNLSFRSYKLKKELESELWRVNWTEITFPVKNKDNFDNSTECFIEHEEGVCNNEETTSNYFQSFVWSGSRRPSQNDKSRKFSNLKKHYLLLTQDVG